MVVVGVVAVVAGIPPADSGATLLGRFKQSLSCSTVSLDTVPVQALDAVRAAHLTAAATDSGASC